MTNLWAHQLVDAGPARRHAHRLRAAGWGTRTLASRAGVHRRVVQALLAARTSRSAPSRQVRADTEDRILSVAITEVPPCRKR